jgi:hypothetical protein
MLWFLAAAQVVVAVSVLFVWVMRLTNVEREFREYRLSDRVRNAVGAAKISAAALLLAGLWYPGLVLPAASVMAGFMLCAQYFHFRARHPAAQYLASFVLLVLSLLLAWSARGSLL